MNKGIYQWRVRLSLLALLVSALYVSWLPVSVQSQSNALIMALDWNRDGSLLAVGRLDGMIEIRDRMNQIIVSQSVTNTTIQSIVWNPVDVNTIAVSDRQGTITVWNYANNQLTTQLQIISRQNRIPQIEWSPDGLFIAGLGELGEAASIISSVGIWDSSTGVLIGSYQDLYKLRDIAWRPSVPTEILISGVLGGYGAQVVLWDINSGTVWTYDDSDAGVVYLAWNPDGSQFAILKNGLGSSDPTANAQLTLHDPATGQRLSSFDTGISNIPSIDWYPNVAIALASRDKIPIFDATTGHVTDQINVEGFVRLIDWSVTGDLAYSLESVTGIASLGVENPQHRRHNQCWFAPD
jgi:WD40 repeat protein